MTSSRDSWRSPWHPRGAGGTVPFEGVAFKGVGYRFGARKSKPMMNVVMVVVR